MFIMTRLFSILLIGLVFLLSGCGDDEAVPPPSAGTADVGPDAEKPSAAPTQQKGESLPDPLRLLEDRAQLSQFHALLVEAGLAADIRNQPGQLIIAPTNTAFEALPTEVMAALRAPENGDELRDLLKYHLVNGIIGADQLGEDITELQSRLGPVIPVRRVGDLVTVGDAVVIGIEEGAWPAALILIVDRVLLPPAG